MNKHLSNSYSLHSGTVVVLEAVVQVKEQLLLIRVDPSLSGENFGKR